MKGEIAQADTATTNAYAHYSTYNLAPKGRVATFCAMRIFDYPLEDPALTPVYYYMHTLRTEKKERTGKDELANPAPIPNHLATTLTKETDMTKSTKKTNLRTQEVTAAPAERQAGSVSDQNDKGDTINPHRCPHCEHARMAYTLELESDKYEAPECVLPSFAKILEAIHAFSWPTPADRASGMRKLLLVSLGSKDRLTDAQVDYAVKELALHKCVPEALRAAAAVHPDEKHRKAMLEAAIACENASVED